jgi:uncharacterized protein
MTKIFADTGYWIALLNRHDQLHQRAILLSQTLQPTTIVTTELVLIELLNDFGSRNTSLRAIAINTLEALQSDPKIQIIPQTPEHFQAAFSLYAQRPDKAWSLTDCLSFIIMSEQQITSALSYDQHFRQAGFEALMRTET